MEKLRAAETTRAPRRRRRKAEGEVSEKGRRGRLGCGRGQRGGGDGKAVEAAMAMSVPSLTLTPHNILQQPRIGPQGLVNIAEYQGEMTSRQC